MTYVPKWESLGSVLQRVIQAGIAEAQAMEQICAAMLDGVVRARTKRGGIPPALLFQKVQSASRELQRAPRLGHATVR